MARPKGMARGEVRQHSAERLAAMRAAGIKFVEVLGSNSADDCEACLAMLGQPLEIELATALPLPGCDQEFCKCIYITSQ